jgi:hypothetical protein
MVEVSEISEKIYSLLGLDKRHDNLVTFIIGSMIVSAQKGEDYKKWYNKHKQIICYSLEEFNRVFSGQGMSSLTEDELIVAYSRCRKDFCHN